jgi:TRAP-type transport system small permease protein
MMKTSESEELIVLYEEDDPLFRKEEKQG